MLITLITGSRGSGKTLLMLWKGLEASKQGMPVYVNADVPYFIHKDWTAYESVNHLLEMQPPSNAVVLIDAIDVFNGAESALLALRGGLVFATVQFPSALNLAPYMNYLVGVIHTVNRNGQIWEQYGEQTLVSRPLREFIERIHERLAE